MKKLKPYRRWFHIPIYDSRLLLVVADDLRRERARFVDTFGPQPDAPYTALASYNTYGDFALFLRPSASINVRAHEIFHVTHRMMEWAECHFDMNHTEQGSLLSGYLHDLVEKQFSRVCSRR